MTDQDTPQDKLRERLARAYLDDAFGAERARLAAREREIASWEKYQRRVEGDAERRDAELRERRDAEMRERFALARRSQWFAFASMLAALGTTLALALTGHDNVAISVITVTVVPVVGLYITGKYAERKDTAEVVARSSTNPAQR